MALGSAIASMQAIAPAAWAFAPALLRLPQRLLPGSLDAAQTRGAACNRSPHVVPEMTAAPGSSIMRLVAVLAFVAALPTCRRRGPTHAHGRRAVVACGAGVEAEVVMQGGAADQSDGEGATMVPRKRALRKLNPLRKGRKSYAPGEGYGSNVIPFVGIAPKSMKGRKSENRAEEAMKLIEKATDPKRIERIRAARSRELVRTAMPIPKDMVPELIEGGWLDAMKEKGCQVWIDENEEEVEDHGVSWQTLRIAGNPEAVNEASLLLSSGLAPRLLRA